MQYHIARNGQQAGTFSEDEVRARLQSNEFSPADLCWTEGMTDWQPLGVKFPEADGFSTGGDINPYAPPQAGVDRHPGGGALADTGERNGPAWEQRATLGIPKAITETFRAVLFQPVQAFTTMKRDGGIWVPLSYFMINATIGIIASQLYNILFQGTMLTVMSGLTAGEGGQPFPATAMAGGSVILGITGVVVMLIIVPLWHFISSGLVHGTLVLLKGANHPFETTFRVTSYATGSAMLFYVLPVCGAFVGWVWAIVVTCIGLGKAHDTSTEKGVGATLIPMAVCCFLVVGLYITLFGAIFSAATKSAGH